MNDASVFRRLLGDGIDRLPEAVRRAHDQPGRQAMSGLAQVEVRAGWLPWLLCAVLGFPAPGRDVPVTVVFDATPARDHWARRFAGRRYASTLLPGTGRDAGLLLECMGPLTNVFALQPEPDRLRFSLLRCRFFGVPLPRCLTPRCEAEERMEEGGFVFDVPIEMPGVGRLIRYRGRIVAEGREV